MKFKTPDVTHTVEVLTGQAQCFEGIRGVCITQAAEMLASLAAERDELYKALEYARNVICASEGRDQFTLVEGNPIDAALEGGDRATGIMARMYISAQKKLDAEREMLNWLLGRLCISHNAPTQDIWKIITFAAPKWNSTEKGPHDMRAIVAQAMGE